LQICNHFSNSKNFETAIIFCDTHLTRSQKTGRRGIILNPRLATSPLEQPNHSIQEILLDMVTFRLGRQAYALPIDIIYQIIDMVTITRLPQADASIEGIINYHGTAVPVVDLRRFLRLPKIPVHLHTPIILVAFSGQMVGLIVDTVLGVLSCPQRSLLRARDLLPEDLGDISILDGVIQSSDSFFLLMNLEHLLPAQLELKLAEALNNLNLSPQVPADTSPSGIAPAEGGQEDENVADDNEIVPTPGQNEQ
jgi:purine-binding chemotaxis protein CheW